MTQENVTSLNGRHVVNTYSLVSGAWHNQGHLSICINIISCKFSVDVTIMPIQRCFPFAFTYVTLMNLHFIFQYYTCEDVIWFSDKTLSLYNYCFESSAECLHVIYQCCSLFSLPVIARNSNDGKQTHQHLAFWTLKLPSLFFFFSFILLPTAHSFGSFWGPLAVVPITHPKTPTPTSCSH